MFDKKYKALALLSGGLDSVLAVKLVREQGVEVIPVYFESPFFTADEAKQVAEKLGWKLIIKKLKHSYLKVLANPDYGYGKNLNPCIDCHAFMFNKLGKMLREFQADFLVSGEVLGQRPKSQNRIPMNTVSKASGYKDLIVRPLSQKLLPDTKPLREGWLDKEKLLDIEGRSRKIQLALAREYNIKSYLSTGGGCRLTDKHFCRRVQDLMEQNMWKYKYVKFLTWGRHFRLNEKTKLVLGRNKNDNDALEKLITENNITLLADDYTGPLGILMSTEEIEQEDFKFSAGILLRYITEAEGVCRVNFFQAGEKIMQITVEKLLDSKTRKYLL